jgi:hypothetical protein
VPVGHRVIDTLGAARLAEDFSVGEPSGEQPLVEPMPGVAERRVEGLPLARGEPVERDREVVDANARNDRSFGDGGRSDWVTRPVARLHRPWNLGDPEMVGELLHRRQTELDR